MKYSRVFEKDGYWYVLKGNKKFFPCTKSNTEKEAKDKAAALSTKYYLEQALKSLEFCDDLLSNENSYYRNIYLNVACLKNKIEIFHQKHSDYDENDPCTWC